LREGGLASAAVNQHSTIVLESGACWKVIATVAACVQALAEGVHSADVVINISTKQRESGGQIQIWAGKFRFVSTDCRNHAIACS
jgi:hypothetical protein